MVGPTILMEQAKCY